jgi:FtsZ-interacting cell division protein YlmF
MGELTTALKSLADFLRIDESLIEAAAQGSPGRIDAAIGEGDLRDWIQSLPGREKDEMLVRIATGQDQHYRAELLQQFRRNRRADPEADSQKRRTAGQLLAVAEERRTIRRREAAEREARERARREKEEAVAREKRLDALAGRQPQIWDQVEALIATKQPQKYDQAVASLKDLRDLAARSRTQEAFAASLAALRERHSKKPTLLRRLDGLKGA